ncbi:FAD-binding oxidoreductase [Homoserinibacter sp. GY 40078]|uniref:FAD-binding oxidoreductase n=1 Tax=Homoserinibacter sp. GY 40078 TaxID=2603275 RepID=UPI002101EC9A|nr:FAD-binding oxidoreductase [Homoserinibacter sp. GY 40078]
MTRRPTGWHAAKVTALHPETASARRIELEVPTWPGNDPGAHLDIRLTAPDGYQASRSYSIASSGEGTRVVLAVDEVPNGEVSPFLVEDLLVDDMLEVHGPLGSYFIWSPDSEERPVQLIAGGSGVVPLFAMAEAHALAGDASGFRMLYSVRTPADRFFASDLEGFAAHGSLQLDYVYTRQTPAGWAVPPGRITREVLEAAAWPAEVRPIVYVCGPTPFVETVAGWLTELGHDPRAVLTERFGGG